MDSLGSLGFLPSIPVCLFVLPKNDIEVIIFKYISLSPFSIPFYLSNIRPLQNKHNGNLLIHGYNNCRFVCKIFKCYLLIIFFVMELFINPTAPETFLIRLILSYLKLVERGKINVVAMSEPALNAIKNGHLKLELPTLITAKSEVITETFQITKYLLSIQPAWATFFLGETPEEQEEISNIKVHLKEGKDLRKYLQRHLESRTFFVGKHLTFADLFMFSRLYENMVEMKDEQKMQFNNLFRWYKHIQNLPEIKAFLQNDSKLILADPEPKLTFLEVKKKKK